MCVCRLHLCFYCLLLSLLAHNGLSNCIPLTGTSNHGWGSGSHYERAAKGQRSDVYQRLLEQRAAVCHMDACWGLLPATNLNSYTFRQFLHMQSVCSKLKQENTEKTHWGLQCLTTAKSKWHTPEKDKQNTNWQFVSAQLNEHKGMRYCSRTLYCNVLNPTVYFCKIITVKAVLPTGAPLRSLSVWLNRSFSWTSLSREGQRNSTDNDMFRYPKKQTCV